MLTSRQQLTVQHLKDKGLVATPKQIVVWCQEKLLLPCDRNHRSRTGRRKHSKEHYQQILEYYLPLAILEGT